VTAERAQRTAERAQRTAERAQRVADIGEYNFRISRVLGFTFAPLAMLDSLRPITLASWNATGADESHNLPISMCTPGTRVSLLEDLMAWATASDSPCVFWLNGLAGTGKSTIARTLCERLDAQGLLGASFFISRDQSERRDVSNIVRSIAHQLAVRWRPVSDALCTELCEAPTSKARSLREQITDFIIIPARALPASSSFILVIDAMDEAVTDFLDRPGGDLLLLLVPQFVQLAGRVRLLITSRNEIPIQQMFRELSATPQTVNTVKLHELDKVVVRDDYNHVSEPFVQRHPEHATGPRAHWLALIRCCERTRRAVWAALHLRCHCRALRGSSKIRSSRAA
jgi:hypothetical protein